MMTKVTTKILAEVVFIHCCEYLESLSEAKAQTINNFHLHYSKQTTFSLFKMKRVPKYTREQSIKRAINTTILQFSWTKINDVMEIKNLAFQDLSATMQVSSEAWNLINNRFIAITPENLNFEDLEDL